MLQREMKIHKAGFTLIELIVVIGIIGIMVGVAAPNFRSFTLNARLNLSRDLIVTELSDAFSSARSSRDLHRVSGELGANEVVQSVCSREQVCTDPVNPGSCSEVSQCEVKEVILLEPGIVIREDFLVDYVPPHGDVVFNEDEQAALLLIQIQDDFEGMRGIEINKTSGRIEVLNQEEVDTFLRIGN
jgi:prepilin-type N-terminal cleavage/methylation domain-containing protein